MKKRILLERNQSAIKIRSLYDNRDGTYTLRIETLDFDLKNVSDIEMNYGMFSEALASYENWSINLCKKKVKRKKL